MKTATSQPCRSLGTGPRIAFSIFNGAVSGGFIVGKGIAEESLHLVGRDAASRGYLERRGRGIVGTDIACGAGRSRRRNR